MRCNRRELLAIALIVIASAIPVILLAVTPIDEGFISPAQAYTINESAGDQFDPHVDGDIASYTSNAGIRFYNFFSGDDTPVPNDGGVSDRLSDVSNGKIVFVREDDLDGDSRIFVYDPTTSSPFEVDHQDGQVLRTNPGIGGNTVAFIDLLLAAGGELMASALGGTTVRVTTDLRSDSQPLVSPAGDLIVWRSCDGGALTCDIHKATWSGSAWSVADVTANSDSDENPDTDGVVIVYDSTRSGERDIYWKSATGTVEQRLELPGRQRNPSVSGGVIVFESTPADNPFGPADVFAYEIATNRLFQLVSSPANESLNDVSSLGDGRFRVVFSRGEAPNRDVLGADFQLPDVVEDFDFGGFLQPVDPYPTLNSMKAGAAVAVKFSLGGFQGLDIFAAGYPKSQTIPCASTVLEDGIEQTVTAGNSSLSYDAATDQYSYVWKTDKAWVGTCRQLVVKFTDDSLQYANFKLK